MNGIQTSAVDQMKACHRIKWLAGSILGMEEMAVAAQSESLAYSGRRVFICGRAPIAAAIALQSVDLRV